MAVFSITVPGSLLITRTDLTPHLYILLRDRLEAGEDGAVVVDGGGGGGGVLVGTLGDAQIVRLSQNTRTCGLSGGVAALPPTVVIASGGGI